MFSLMTIANSITAIHEVMETLRKEIVEMPENDPNICDLQEAELSYWKSLEELRKVYEVEQKKTLNFLPYHVLIGEEEEDKD
jgi:hypothetical protein